MESKEKLLMETHPLTLERWPDFERLFGEKGACGGCWCMSWRLTRGDFEKQKGEGNKLAMRELVRSGKVPGLLAYVDKRPMAWVSVSPREDFVRLEKHRTLKRVDDKAVWSVVCFFIIKAYRRQGVSVALLKAALEHVREQGGTMVEGYPMDPNQESLPGPFVWTGLASAFLKTGFKEVARPAATRPIMRYALISSFS